MKVLLYGMQSSGASMLAFTFAQRPRSLAFIDIWNMFAAPELETDRDCVAKVVVTTAFGLEVHRRRFRPDVTILALRHPADTYESLVGKDYANDSGLIDEKFALLDQVFREDRGFDDILFYEDFVFSPQDTIAHANRLGWAIGSEALLFSRTLKDIEQANVDALPDLHNRLKYGAGNIGGRGVMRDRVRFAEPWGKTSHLPQVCPALFEHYAQCRATRGELWHIPSRALLSCDLSPILRGQAVSGEILPESERAGYKLQLTNGTPHSKVTDTELILGPAANGKCTEFTVAGLPGHPFNRICGSVFSVHPLARGTLARIRIEGPGGVCLAEKELRLSHLDMRNIELAFEPQSDTLTLSLSLSVPNGAQATEQDSLCFRGMRLEQTAG
jgi:hypothetical protein